MNISEREFYRLVLAVGACIAAADGSPDSNELQRLKGYFRIPVDELPEASSIYNGQLHGPHELPRIIRNSPINFSDRSEMAEAFLLGMCEVAASDGNVSNSERSLLTLLSSCLHLSEQARTRVFLAANIVEVGKSPEKPLPEINEERTRHLSILGLLSNATSEEVEDEYKRLVKRFHPDRLRSQHMPEGEKQRAERLLTQINASYRWLKSHQN